MRRYFMPKFEIIEWGDLTQEQKKRMGFSATENEKKSEELLRDMKRFFYFYNGEEHGRLWVIARDIHGLKSLVLVKGIVKKGESHDAFMHITRRISGERRTPIQEMFLRALTFGKEKGHNTVAIAGRGGITLDNLMRWGREKGYLVKRNQINEQIPEPCHLREIPRRESTRKAPKREGLQPPRLRRRIGK